MARDSRCLLRLRSWLGIGVLCAAAAQGSPFARGLKLMMDARYDEAVIYLETAHVGDPKNARVLDKLAVCCVRTGDYARAAKLMRDAAQRGGPTSWRMSQEADALGHMAKAQLPKGRADLAAKHLALAVNARTHHPEVPLEAALALGAVHFDAKRYTDAAEAYAKPAEARYDGLGWPALQQYLVSLVEADRSMEALAVFDAFRERIPEQRPDAFDLALLRAHERIVDKALAGRPDHRGVLLMARHVLVRGLERNPVTSKARTALEDKTLKTKALLCQVLTADGDAAMAKGDTRAAIIAYDDVRQLCRGIDPEAYYGAKNTWYAMSCDAEKRFMEGFGLAADGDHREAVAAFDDVLRKWPRAKHAHKASSCRSLGKRPEAAQYYKQLLSTYPESGFVPWCCVEIAEYHSEVKQDIDESIRWLRYAVDHVPDGHNCDRAQYWLAETYWEELGNYKQSYLELKKLLKLFPESDLRRRVELRIEYIERYSLKNVDGKKSRGRKKRQKGK